MPRLILILPLFWGCESEEQSVPHWETRTWSSLGEKKLASSTRVQRTKLRENGGSC